VGRAKAERLFLFNKVDARAISAALAYDLDRGEKAACATSDDCDGLPGLHQLFQLMMKPRRRQAGYHSKPGETKREFAYTSRHKS